MAEICSWPIRAIIHLYDLTTLPVYLLLQRPWTLWPRIWMKRSVKDTSSSWVFKDYDHSTSISKYATVSELLQNSLNVNKSKPCLGHRVVFEQIDLKEGGKVITKKLLDNRYTWMSYEDVNSTIDKLVHGMVNLGISSGDKVVIMLDTSPEWQLLAQSILRLGATLCTLYPTLGRVGTIHSINELEAKVIILSDCQANSLDDLEKDVPFMTTIIVVGKKQVQSTNRLIFKTLDEVIELGKYSGVWTHKPKPQDMAVIMYTSGSTGLPKGVVLTHHQLVSAFAALNSRFRSHNWTDATFLAFLPLSHIFEFIFELSILTYGGRIGYGSPLTWVDTSSGLVTGSLGDATVLNPTIMILVPLFLDRIRLAINDQVIKKGALFNKLFQFFVEYKTFWQSIGFDTPLLNWLVFKRTKSVLGTRCVEAMVGAAPLSSDTQKFSRAVLDINLLQIYGATECVAISTIMDRFDHSLGRVGAPYKGVFLKLQAWSEGGYSPEDKPNPRGELIQGGDNVSSGYFKRETETEEAFQVDSSGMRWFVSGDIVEVFSDGTFKIIDRKKYLVKLQHGEYISLGKVEAALRRCQFVEMLCAYGDSRFDYTVALIVPNRPKVLQVALESGYSGDIGNWTDICNNVKVNQYLMNAINEIGVNSELSRREIPTKIKLCTEEWTPTSGLVTPSLKIKRRQITDFYKKDIESMYDA